QQVCCILNEQQQQSWVGIILFIYFLKIIYLFIFTLVSLNKHSQCCKIQTHPVSIQSFCTYSILHSVHFPLSMFINISFPAASFCVPLVAMVTFMKSSSRACPFYWGVCVLFCFVLFC
uniref:Uncharacterized protein n=1 Tax=Latimeria chalumnae TaxID=7897 RepID=H3BIJ0_LATCH